MINVVLASNNQGKIAEFGTILSVLSSEITVHSLHEMGICGEIEENGATFAENSLIKALTPTRYGYIGMADDSGLTVDALYGAPGIFSARYAGMHGDDVANRQLLLQNLKEVPEEKRSAAFVCVITMAFPEDMPIFVPEKWRADISLCRKYAIRPEHTISVCGECRGRIAFAESGNGGFGYDSLFLYGAGKKTFAEMTQTEKNAVSHRGVALALLSTALHDADFHGILHINNQKTGE